MRLLKRRAVKLSSYDKQLTYTMRGLGDETRFKIFKLLLAHKELCVTEIADYLEISVPAVSQHFRIFEMIGLVERERMGQKICYKLQEDDSFVRKLILFAKH